MSTIMLLSLLLRTMPPADGTASSRGAREEMCTSVEDRKMEGLDSPLRDLCRTARARGAPGVINGLEPRVMKAQRL